MGREVRRVSLDFDWPLNKIWEGFLNPHYKHCKECPFCERSGLNPESKQVADDYYDFARTGRKWGSKLTQDEVDALLDEGRLSSFNYQKWDAETKEWEDLGIRHLISADMVNRWNEGIPYPRNQENYDLWCRETNALFSEEQAALLNNSIKGSFGGHDAINRWIVVKQRCKRLGIYGECDHCKGEGEVWRKPEDEVNAEAWKEILPPEGDAYQIWETTSEGSPITPPFATPEELAKWAADNGASVMGGQTTTYNKWLNFIRGPGWAPTMLGRAGQLQSGVDAVSTAPLVELAKCAPEEAPDGEG